MFFLIRINELTHEFLHFYPENLVIMERKDFLKKALLGTGAIAAGTALAATATSVPSEPASNKDQVGFNHLPNPKTETMDNVVIHKAATRGGANHGWLNAKHSFSFANYYNPERMHFGVLRVLNDDQIAAGMGFSTHPHDNMEIITIPLSGAVRHKDSMGNQGVIQRGEVQVMSAGTGIYHSEFNHNNDQELKLLQIWLFPNKSGVQPRYDQQPIPQDKHNELYQILSPSADDAGVWIHQNAWFNMGSFDAGKGARYKVHDAAKNGVYAFVIQGELTINGHALEERDGMGCWSTEELTIEANSNAELLLMEVPMNVG